MPFPAVTALVLAPALAAFASPTLAAWLVYDRGLVLEGEVWRVVTGAWVHFSAGHLAWDALAFGAAGLILEPRSRAGLGALVLLATVLGGSALLAFAPGIEVAGGLSGVAVAAVAAVGIEGLRGAPPGRAVSVVLLALVAAKGAAEALAGSAVFASDLPPGVVPLPLVHLAGAAAALGVTLGVSHTGGQVL